MPQPTTPKGKQSRQQILEAATSLIAKQGFLAITIQDILQAANITKGKFFHYFESKEDLFSELLRFALFDRRFIKFSEVLENYPEPSPVRRLLHILDEVIEWQKKGLPDGMRLCALATFFFPPDSAEIQEIRAHLGENSRVMEDLIKSAQAIGELPASLDPALLALLFPSASVGGNIVGYLHSNRPLIPQMQIELKKLVEELADLNISSSTPSAKVAKL